MNILIVLNQAVKPEQIPAHNYLIGVDGGCHYCMEHGLRIDLAIGDFDSLDADDYKKLALQAELIEHYPPEKDFTDCELAIHHAMTMQPDSISVTGVWGGRPDHSLANLLCLATQSDTLPVTMPGSGQNGYLLKSGQTISLEACEQANVSLMSLSESCQGVNTLGLRYPLDSATLRFGVGLGLSNVLVESRAQISLGKGVLLILADSAIAGRLITNKEE